VVEGPLTNTILIDNEYLSRAEETGLVGVLPLVLLIVLPFGRMWRRARADSSPSADLAAALACSFAGYGLSLFLYGAWAYAQEVLVFFMLVAVAGWLVTERPARPGPARAEQPELQRA
jgi:O-antigen ligase